MRKTSLNYCKEIDEPHFNGPDYNPEHDFKRLTGQIARVFNNMLHGQWSTLKEIATSTGDPEASVSAQLRHLRKDRFGGHTILKQRRGDPKQGLWEYCLVPYYKQQELCLKDL